MKFGQLPVREAAGAVLAHSLSIPSGTLKKGRVLRPEDLDRLAGAGFSEVVVARLEPGDVGEDEAAARIARALAGAHVRVAEPFTGRANLFTEAAGLALVSAEHLHALNRLDEAVTVATVGPHERVNPGQMLATIKIIPFAVPSSIVKQAEALAAGAAIAVAPFRQKRAGLILTYLAGTKQSVLAKRERVMAERLAAAGSELAETAVVAHETAAVRAAVRAMRARGRNPILVFAATAIVDRADVIPQGVVAAGGEILHLGMPVDPGNLLLTARIGATDVIGVPSCAGSPKLNGFDWVLERRLADLPAGSAEIAAMGVGGLLKEIGTRPQPRQQPAKERTPRRAARIASVVLAAGRSVRMGQNKLVEDLHGQPIVRHVVRSVLGSGARPVIVVTGHEAERVATALRDLPVTLVHNPDYASGLGSSLRTGLSAMPADVDGVLVALGDMPMIEPEHINRLVSAFSPKEGRAIVVPAHEGKRGNPVLWAAEFIPAMRQAEGDTGARHLFREHSERLVEIELGTDAVLVDVDTPEALAQLRGGDCTCS